MGKKIIHDFGRIPGGSQRSESWAKALEFATQLYNGHLYVPSPFGGYIPKRLRDHAEQRKRYWRHGLT